MTTEYPRFAIPRLAGETIKGLPAVTGRIHVDQFGYLPEQPKVAVISDPQQGYNAMDHYTPGSTLEVRRRSDQVVIFKGAPVQWNKGQVDPDSSDRGWWFDLSTVKEPGEYYVYDPSTKLRSPVFKIAQDVYYPILRSAVRMFYFQRQTVELDARHVEGPWVDKPALMQDARARAVWAKDDPTLERDLSGGWMDAGDTNKYPTFMGEVIHPLLHAYTANPQAFGDDYNIPESGNGLPDLLDEVKFELEWLKKMQDADGGVFIKMGNIDFKSKWPLSDDPRTRYYGHKSSASTLWTAGNFAHAARVYSKFPVWKSFADDLQQRALKAWAWYESHPREDKPDNGEIKSGLANRSLADQDRMEGFTAIHLWALTGDEKFHKIIRERAVLAKQLTEGRWAPHEAGSAESLLDYAAMEKADPVLKQKILKALADSAANKDFAPPTDVDLYRAWMAERSYHWGSCQPRAGYGFAAIQVAEHTNVSADEKARLVARAADMLHSFHGVNPLSAVMLTNMTSLGAELSMKKFYHERWGGASKFVDNPPPGYVVGGVNAQFKGKAKDGDHSIEWISQQPKGKSYADFDLGSPEASWEITEPAIYYQALYIRLLADFTHPAAK